MSPLWTAQVILFVAFGMAGVMKSTMPVEQLSQSMAWVPRFSPGVVRLIGTSELCGAIGVLVPSLTRIKPGVTQLAALGLTTLMILAAGHHAMNNEGNVWSLAFRKRVRIRTRHHIPGRRLCQTFMLNMIW